MLPIPAGAVRLVTIAGTRDFTIEPVWMSRTEITWDLYDIFVFGLNEADSPEEADAVTRPSKPYISMDRGFGHNGYPVIAVSARGATQFCAWLSALTGRRYRLPTAAEWIYACQHDGSGTVRPDTAWLQENADFKTHPVAKKMPNTLGLHDMIGNAAEWCTLPEGGFTTMGGSYRTSISDARCTFQELPHDAWNASDPQIPKSEWWLADAGFVGFRVVCEPVPVKGY